MAKVRIVFGTVDQEGAKSVKGSGDWSSKREKKGRYAISIDPPLESTPIVQLTLQGGSEEGSRATVDFGKSSVSTMGFQAQVVSGDGSNKDEAFSFAAFAIES